MADRFVASTAGPLLPLLAAHFATWSRNTLRQRLHIGCIDVNGTPVTRHDHALRPGDVVEIHAKGDARAPRRGRSLAVLFDDDDLLAIDKPAGLLSVASDDEHERTALALLREQVGGPLWPAHRLDRETSGVLLFARSADVQKRVQAAWGEAHKEYLAVVDGAPQPPAGAIELPLREDATLHVRAGSHPDARPACTRYRTLASAGGRTLLAVELDTGRKHQIRAHLAAIGCPVVGDARYGTRGPRLLLHAVRLALPHPRTGRPLSIEAPPPAAFCAASPT